MSFNIVDEQRLEDTMRKLYNSEFDKVDGLIENIVEANNVAIENTFTKLEQTLDKVFPIVEEGYTHRITIIKNGLNNINTIQE